MEGLKYSTFGKKLLGAYSGNADQGNAEISETNAAMS
jgi:hypothetical protein